MSIFQHRRFRRFRSAVFDRPRRPRHPMLRLALGLLAVAVLLGLVVVGVFVGAAMLAAGLLWRLWRQRGKRPMPARRAPGSIDGDFRVVGKSQLHHRWT